MTEDTSDSIHPIPIVSVIIPVYNDADRLQTCLEALDRQTHPTNRLEILVVDNGSEDDLESVVEHFGKALLLKEPKRGSYAARNHGIRKARGEIIAFTDADCLPSPTWIEKGLAHLVRDPSVGLVGGRIDVVPADPSKPTAVELYDVLTGFPQSRYINDLRFAATASAFTRKSVLDQVGDFNDELLSGGDRDWGERVDRAGFSLRYADDVVTRHPARRSVLEIYEKLKRVHAGARDSGAQGDKVAAATRFLRRLVPPVGVAWRMFHDERVPTFWSWVRLAGVLTLVRLMNAWMTLRFAVVGTSPRQ